MIELQDWVDVDEVGPIAGPDAVSRFAPLLALGQSELERADAERLSRRIRSYAHWFEVYFSRQQSTDDIVGQDNLLRYRACRRLLVVAAPGSTSLDLISVIAAAQLCGPELHISVAAGEHAPLDARAVEALGRACRLPIRAETPNELAIRLSALEPERARWLGAPGAEAPEALLRAAARIGCHVSQRPVLGHGRYELAFYHREQAISRDYHRYGHLGFKSPDLERPARSPERVNSGGRTANGAQPPSLNTNSSAMFSPSGPAARGP